MRLVPKNLRNYLQTPTLIGCRFLTNPEATYRLLRLALLRSAKPCSLSRFFKYRQTFFAFNIFFSHPTTCRCETLKLFQRSLRLCTVFSNRVNFEGSFFNQPLLPQPLQNHRLKRLASVVSRAHEYTSLFQASATSKAFVLLIRSAPLAACASRTTRLGPYLSALFAESGPNHLHI